MGKLTIFGQTEQAFLSPPASPSRPPFDGPNSVASPSVNGIKSPKRAKFFDDAPSDDDETVSSSSRRRVSVNGVDKGKLRRDDSLNKRRRKERAEALLSARQDLPVHAGKVEILKAVAENETVIILGETGSGKTTQIPQYLLGAAACGEDNVPARIAVTQPRRVAAVSLAARVAEEMGVRLGGRCGYSVRFDDRSGPSTRLKFVTDGTLLQEVLGDGLLASYDVVVLDEAHERTLRTDMLMGFLKLIQRRRRDLVAEGGVFPGPGGKIARALKIVVMSATLDAEKFSEYYDGIRAKILYIKGRQHPVQIMYVRDAQSDYVQAALHACLQIHVAHPPGDVLVFLAGQDEIESVQSQLGVYIEDLPPSLDQLMVCPLYARLPPSQQQKAFNKAPPHTRKIILATNVAETSVTIPGVRYVVDTGVAKLKRFAGAAAAVEQLLVEPISKSSAQQRAGRAGREAPGRCFRLYPASVFDAVLPATTPPEISRTSFTFTALHLVAAGVEEPLKFPFMEPPGAAEVKMSLMQLAQMGAVVSPAKDGKLQVTALGRQMARLPLDPPLAKALVDSFERGCPRDVIDLLAMLEQADSVLISTVATRDQAAEARAKFAHPDGDHMMLINVLRAYDAVHDRSAEARQWCRDHFVNAKAMANVVEARKQLRQRCEQLGFDPNPSCGDAATPILLSMLAGQTFQVAVRQPDGTMVHALTKLTIKIHPSSCLHGRPVELVLYHELVHTTATYARICSRIRPPWYTEAIQRTAPPRISV